MDLPIERAERREDTGRYAFNSLVAKVVNICSYMILRLTQDFVIRKLCMSDDVAL